MSKKPCRGAFSDTLLALAKTDQNIYAVVTDSRGSALIDQFAEELPNQFVEIGIAEQNAVGFAAGLALSGKRPFVVGPACFMSTRAAEQVKVDVAYSHANVKLIGISGGVSYGALGATHHSLQDIAYLRAIPDLRIIIPADVNQTICLTKKLTKDSSPCYVRVGRGAVPDVYDAETEFEIGKAVWHGTKGDVAIIACGETVYHALRTKEKLKEKGINVFVLDMHTIKPMDKEAVLQAAKESKAVLTVEEHSVNGGLGGAVCELLCNQEPKKIRTLGMPDEYLVNGESGYLYRRYGLDADGMEKAIIELLSEEQSGE